MTATSSDAESLREQIRTALHRNRIACQGEPFSNDADGDQHARRHIQQADALIAAVPALQRLIEVGKDGVIINRALLDTAQPDLRRTPEAEIDVERLAQAMRAVLDATTRERVLPYVERITAEYKRLAATRAPAALDPIAYFKEQLPDALDAMAEDQAKYDALPLPTPAPADCASPEGHNLFMSGQRECGCR